MSDDYDWFRPEDLPFLFDALRTTTPEGILVGGQSLVFWAEYLGLEIPEANGLYLTQDVDILGSQAFAKAVARKLRAQVHIPQPGDSTPNTAIVRYKTPDGRKLHIDFMGSIAGLSETYINRDKIVINHQDFGIITVLHPRHVLQSRLANLYTIPNKRNNNGIAQAHVAIRMIRVFYDELPSLLKLSPRQTERHYCNFFEWLLYESLSERGKHCFHHFDIDLMTVAPVNIIQSRDFHSKRLSQAFNYLDYMRQRSHWRQKGEAYKKSRQ